MSNAMTSRWFLFLQRAVILTLAWLVWISVDRILFSQPALEGAASADADILEASLQNELDAIVKRVRLAGISLDVDSTNGDSQTQFNEDTNPLRTTMRPASQEYYYAHGDDPAQRQNDGRNEADLARLSANTLNNQPPDDDAVPVADNGVGGLAARLRSKSGQPTEPAVAVAVAAAATDDDTASTVKASRPNVITKSLGNAGQIPKKSSSKEEVVSDKNDDRPNYGPTTYPEMIPEMVNTKLPDMEPPEATDNLQELSFSDSSLKTDSPTGISSFIFQLDAVEGYTNCMTYRLSHRGKVLTETSTLRYGTRTTPHIPICNLRVVQRTRATRQAVWSPLYGERSELPDNFVEDVISLGELKGDKPVIKLIIRAFDQGVAWNIKLYTISRPPDLVIPSGVSILSLISNFVFENDGTAYVDRGNEFGFAKYRLSDKLSASLWSDDVAAAAPLHLELDVGANIAIMEARNWDFRSLAFRTPKSTLLDLVTMYDITITEETAQVFSPWWLVVMGSSAADMISNRFIIENLNDPSIIPDTSWIRPGKGYRDMTLSTYGVKAAMTFANSFEMSYVLMDAGWYGSEHDPASDATRAIAQPKKDELDWKRVLKFSRDKNVGLFLYVNDKHLNKQIKDLVKYYSSWGVKGIKFGFVTLKSSTDIRRIMNFVLLCAKYKLLVNIHDNYRPSGLSRTLPNLMSQEGIRGDEHQMNPQHSLFLPFTRLLSGGADHTYTLDPGRLSNMGKSVVHQVALPICLYNPMQHLFWYLDPWTFERTWDPSLAIFTVWRRMPSTWEDTIIINAVPLKLYTVARKSHSGDWFIATINSEPATFQLSLSFLPQGRRFDAEIINDNEEKPFNEFSVVKDSVTQDSSISVTVHQNSGHVVLLRPNF